MSTSKCGDIIIGTSSLPVPDVLLHAPGSYLTSFVSYLHIMLIPIDHNLLVLLISRLYIQVPFNSLPDSGLISLTFFNFFKGISPTNSNQRSSSRSAVGSWSPYHSPSGPSVMRAICLAHLYFNVAGYPLGNF